MEEINKGRHNVYVTLGASNHAKEERQAEDFYATSPSAVDKLAKVFEIPKNLYESAVGQGHLAKRLKELGHNVYSTDLIDRGYGDKVGVDFLELDEIPKGYSIFTNPPYSRTKSFILKALDLVDEGQYVIMLLKLQHLEGKARYEEIFSKYPPKYVYVFSERLLCAKNGDFEKARANGGSSIAYIWAVFQKGNYSTTELKWC